MKKIMFVAAVMLFLSAISFGNMPDIASAAERQSKDIKVALYMTDW